MVFGVDFSGYDQRYVSMALRLHTPGWSFVVGEYTHLMHAVEAGNGLRFSVVLTNPLTTTEGRARCGRATFA